MTDKRQTKQRKSSHYNGMNVESKIVVGHVSSDTSSRSVTVGVQTPRERVEA